MSERGVAFRGWPAEALGCYEGREVDNSKAYWPAHKELYELAVLALMTALLAELAPEFGQSKVFRPHRDVRFSADKSPCKAHIGAVIGTGYVQLPDTGLATASGMRRMAADQLDRYRRAVADEKTGPDLEQVIRGAHVLVDPLRVYSNPGAPADATRQGLSSLTRPTENERKYQ
jgi:hypothetical protein